MHRKRRRHLGNIMGLEHPNLRGHRQTQAVERALAVNLVLGIQANIQGSVLLWSNY